MSVAPERLAIGFPRRFPTPRPHPYAELAWECRDARITNWQDGSVAFEQLAVEFPVMWSQNATNITAQKYFRGHLGTPDRERSVRQVTARAPDTTPDWGVGDGFFVDDREAESFRDELKAIL